MAEIHHFQKKTIKLILGNDKKILPIKLNESFKVRTKVDKEFIAKNLAQVPYNLRISVRNEFNRILGSKSCGLQLAKHFLKGCADFCRKLPVNVTISINQIYKYTNDIVRICIYYKKNNSDKSLLKKLERIVKDLGLVPRQGKSIIGDINRYCNNKWWIRKLKSLYMQSYERVAQYLRLVNDKIDIYLTTHNFKILRENRKRNECFLSSLVAINDTGEVINFNKVVDSSLANPKNRKAEIITRLKGFEQYAEKYNFTADFITITSPSRFHSVYKSGYKNINYDYSSTLDARDYFNKLWAKSRSKLNRLGIERFGFWVIEPHHDGTPHWHFIIFTKKGQRGLLIECLKDYSLEESPDEAGAKTHRFNVKPINKKLGSASGYLVKHICKKVNLSGKSTKLSIEECTSRIYEWGVLWNFHQFEQFGGPPVGVWREARRIALSADINTSSIWKSIKDGDWLAFFEFLGGTNICRKDFKVVIHKEHDCSLNDFGEEKGLVVKGVVIEDEIFISRNHQWSIKPAINLQV